MTSGDRDTRATMRINGWDVLQDARHRWVIEDGRARRGPYESRTAAEAAAMCEGGSLTPYPGFDRLGRPAATAPWDADQQHYQLWIGDQSYYSLDGDVWVEMPSELPASGAAFDAAIIRLSGGPRDGATVS